MDGSNFSGSGLSAFRVDDIEPYAAIVVELGPSPASHRGSIGRQRELHRRPGAAVRPVPPGQRSFAGALLGGAVITLMTWMERSTTSVPAKLVAAVVADADPPASLGRQGGQANNRLSFASPIRRQTAIRRQTSIRRQTGRTQRIRLIGMGTFPPFSHVALTVTDLDTSVLWYDRLFDAEPVMDLDDGDFRRKVYALPGGQLLGLTAHLGTTPGDRFSEKRPGLDHLGFSCTSRDEVKAWADKLSDLGIDHSGIVDAPYGAVLSFKDPDGNALEFFAMGG